MFKRDWVVLVSIIFCAISLASPVFSAEKTGSDKDAILQELSASMDRNPDILRNVVFSIGDDYQRNNKVSEAISLYEKATKVLPNNEDFLNRLGALYNQKGESAKAIDVYKKLTELKPDNTWYFNMLSDAYANAKQNDKAASVWDDLLKKSNNAEAFSQAANFYNRINDTEKAISAMKKAAELKPDNASYLQNLESFYVKAEKFSDAEAICNNVLAAAKDQWQKDWANSELVNIYQKQNKTADLTAKFEKDLASAPKDISQYRKLADLYQRNNEQDKALGVYEKAVSAGLEDRDINNRLLDSYETSGKFDKAEAQIRKIIAGNPNDNYLYERLANLLGKAGKLDDAKKAWQDFLAKVPNDAGAYSRFGDKLNEWKDVDAAVAQYKKAQGMDANNLWYTMRIADLLIGKEKFSDAKKELANIAANTKDTWLKQEAERKIKDIEARTASKVEAAPVQPAQAPVAAPVEKKGKKR